MIALIRITGQIGINEITQETFDRLRLKKKYTCVVIQDKPEITGMLKRIRNFIAYGDIDEKTFAEMINARGKKIGSSKANISEAEAQKIMKDVLAGKKLEELGVKPWFGLHPPRGGIDSKIHFGRKKGVLGNNKENINKLIMRML